MVPVVARLLTRPLSLRDRVVGRRPAIWGPRRTPYVRDHVARQSQERHFIFYLKNEWNILQAINGW